MARKCLELNLFLLLSGAVGSFALKHSAYNDDINVGYCINGLARTFGMPMIYKSIVRNLVKPYGGNPHIFASLTVEEKMSAAAVHHGNPQTSADPHRLERGLKHIKEVLGGTKDTQAAALHAIPGWQEDERIANSFMSFQLQVNLKNALNAFKDLKRESHPGFSTPVVVDLHSDDVNQSVIDETKTATKCKISTESDLYPTFIAQFVHLEQCWNMFTTYEKEHNMTFDRLIYLRPDATWVYPSPPFSDNVTWLQEGIVSNIGGHDWVAVGSRSAMYHWFNRLTWHKEKCVEHLEQYWGGTVMGASVPTGGALNSYFASLGVNFRTVCLSAVVVRDSREMETAQHACQYSAYVWQATGWDCMSSIYREEDGLPRDDESGKWW
eukprot:TRINITY_DN30352_c0_g2_i1.p1 TRINITY_DN30352_c0_g2~~TRINITY_DN30352_c0_g2_i1.p1  ORF type:complete len:381 (-),score=47.54 TRINITY_DN30352_c0_g2_i1:88-1230(-)